MYARDVPAGTIFNNLARLNAEGRAEIIED